MSAVSVEQRVKQLDGTAVPRVYREKGIYLYFENGKLTAI